MAKAIEQSFDHLLVPEELVPLGVVEVRRDDRGTRSSGISAVS
jgi:hypothetical protein